MGYSYLKAVIGSSLEALIAGVTPKITPTNIENPNDKAIDQAVIVVVKKILMIRQIPTPNRIPKIPPNPDNVNASIKN